MDEKQEGRTNTVAAAVTQTERELVKLVAFVRDTDVSNLLRGRSLDDIITEGQRIKSRLRDEAA